MATQQERSQRARIAALTRWAKEDPRPALAKVREGLYARFELEVDPRSELDPAERARRATAAFRAHMARLALASARARRASS